MVLGPRWAELDRHLRRIAEASRRRYEARTRVQIPVVLDAGGWTRRLITVDVSRSGMAVITPEVPDDADVRIVVRRPGLSPLEFQAEVRNRSSAGPSAARLGLRLIGADPKIHDELAAWIAAQVDPTSTSSISRTG